MSASSPSGTVRPIAPGAGGERDGELAQALGAGAGVLAQADLDGEAAAALDGGGDGLAADGVLDEVAEVLGAQVVAGEGVAAGDDVDVDAAEAALVEDRCGCRGRRAGGDSTCEAAALDLAARSGPKTLTPTGVRTPVLSMSTRARIGMV
jgi:hypothetical protein